tara:strand:- start:464 stop:676 length:213 start_codon:yes stop_codon:yes gene_type:complete
MNPDPMDKAKAAFVADIKDRFKKKWTVLANQMICDGQPLGVHYQNELVVFSLGHFYNPYLTIINIEDWPL